MTERAQEDLYFYRINREQIEEIARSQKDRVIRDAEKPTQPLLTPKKPKSLYDYLDEMLQPDEHWQMDL